MRTRLFTWDANRHYMQKEETRITPCTYQCDLCDHTSSKQPGISALHKRTKHNIYPDSYYYVNARWCPICVHGFESIVRVREHLDQTNHPDKIHHIGCMNIFKQVHNKLSEEELEQVNVDVTQN